MNINYVFSHSWNSFAPSWKSAWKKNNWLHSESISVRNGLFQGRSQWGEEEGGWLKTNFVLKKKKLEILGFSLLSTHGNSTFFLLITYPRYSSYFLFTLIPEISICSFFNAPLGRSEALHGGECINSHKYLLCWTYYKSVGFCWTYLSH